MSGKIVRLDPANPGAAFARCRDAVRAGGVIVYPTETFYGLGVDPRNPAAVERVFALKGRSTGQPLLVLLADPAQAPDWAADISPDAVSLMNSHWPGPLTLVFKAQPYVLPAVTGGTGSIGLRVPGNDVTRDLLRFIGTALTGTSANISGGSSATTADEAASALGREVDLILDAGRTAGGRPSTVLDVQRRPFRLIRPGAVEI